MLPNIWNIFGLKISLQDLSKKPRLVKLFTSHRRIVLSLRQYQLRMGHNQDSLFISISLSMFHSLSHSPKLYLYLSLFLNLSLSGFVIFLLNLYSFCVFNPLKCLFI